MNTPLSKPRGPISQRVSVEDGQFIMWTGLLIGLLLGFFSGLAFHIIISR